MPAPAAARKRTTRTHDTGWASYRGEELDGAISKLYWNFAFAVGDADLSGCTLRTLGTADDRANNGDGVDFATVGGIGPNVTYPSRATDHSVVPAWSRVSHGWRLSSLAAMTSSREPTSRARYTLWVSRSSRASSPSFAA